MNQHLISEQIPNDGGWHWDRLVNEANDRLNQIGKHGKRAKIKVTPKPGKPISAQFSLPGKGQSNYGLDLPLNRNNLIKAEEYCQLITTQLLAGTFTENWLYSLIGKNKKVVSDETKILTCKKMLKQYKDYFFKQRSNDKNPNTSWKISYRHTEAILNQYENKPITLQIIREIINKTKNNTLVRTNHLNGLTNLLKYFDNNEFKQTIKRYKAENNPKPKKKYIPSDSEIVFIYQTGFDPKPTCPKRYRYRYPQWQFLYSLLAIYGLRVHEAWNIKNWDKAVTIKDGDWVAIADDKENINGNEEKGKYIYQQWRGNRLIVPAILDSKNEDYLLCIGHETKTGHRVAFPISPNGHSRNCDWIQKFNIIQPLNLPDIPDPLGYRGTNKDNSRGCSIDTSAWFRNKKYGFTPEALRHAYNLRGHNLGVNQKILANSLGHSIQMNGSTYGKHERDISKIQGIQKAISNDTDKRSELERLKARNEYLETEIEKLRTELAMYKAIEQSKHK